MQFGSILYSLVFCQLNDDSDDDSDVAHYKTLVDDSICKVQLKSQRDDLDKSF